MSEPEIARRCSACGVSVRERAVFCPQCGNPIPSQHPATTSIAATDTVVENAPTEALRSDVALTEPPKPKPRPVVHREPEHGVRGRVEQIRKVSSVVIDQAAYDPSLRFLLVAAAMFLLFIVLLILSKVLG